MRITQLIRGRARVQTLIRELCSPSQGLAVQSLGTHKVLSVCRRGGAIQEGFLEEGAGARAGGWALEDAARPWGGGIRDWSCVLCLPGPNTPLE